MEFAGTAVHAAGLAAIEEAVDEGFDQHAHAISHPQNLVVFAYLHAVYYILQSPSGESLALAAVVLSGLAAGCVKGSVDARVLELYHLLGDLAVTH